MSMLVGTWWDDLNHNDGFLENTEIKSIVTEVDSVCELVKWVFVINWNKNGIPYQRNNVIIKAMNQDKDFLSEHENYCFLYNNGTYVNKSKILNYFDIIPENEYRIVIQVIGWIASEKTA